MSGVGLPACRGWFNARNPYKCDCGITIIRLIGLRKGVASTDSAGFLRSAITGNYRQLLAALPRAIWYTVCGNRHGSSPFVPTCAAGAPSLLDIIAKLSRIFKTLS
jgi:hypothetical protein